MSFECLRRRRGLLFNISHLQRCDDHAVTAPAGVGGHEGVGMESTVLLVVRDVDAGIPCSLD